MVLNFSTNFPIIISLLAALFFFCKDQISQLITKYTLFLKDLFFVTFAVGTLERSSILSDLFKEQYLPKYFYTKELIRTDSSCPLSFYIPLGETFLFSKRCLFIIISKSDSDKGRRTEISFFRLFLNLEKIESIFIKGAESSDSRYLNGISKSSEGEILTSLPKKDFNHLAISSTLVRNIISDIDSFRTPEIKRLYQNLGIPYKKSYLLYGKPGHGKSTFIKALASYYNYPIYNLKLDISDGSLLEFVSQLHTGCIVVIEEIDSYPNLIKPLISKKKKLSSREEVPELSWEYDTVTLSGYNQAIDMLGSNNLIDPIIFIITTNHPEKLIDSVIRPGRIDLSIEFIRPSVNDVSKYLELFSSYLDETLSAKILEKYASSEMSPAQLEEEVFYAIRNRKLLNETNS